MDSADSQMDTTRQGPTKTRRRVFWRASAFALFLPGLVVAGGYAGLWLFLSATGRGEGALARVCLLVLVIGVPLILAYAGLRLSTLGLTLRGAHLEVHPGFPARDPVNVAYTAVTRLALRRGLSGWLTGARLACDRTGRRTAGGGGRTGESKDSAIVGSVGPPAATRRAASPVYLTPWTQRREALNHGRLLLDRRGPPGHEHRNRPRPGWMTQHWSTSARQPIIRPFQVVQFWSTCGALAAFGPVWPSIGRSSFLKT